jgi:glycosyltransferase involved in cell wall biosynthesis
MRIVHLAAGAASMYCGACARDAAMARALMERGHEVLIVPLYTPLRIETAGELPVSEVHLGALNAYVQQLTGRRLPGPLASLLDRESLLRFVSRFAVSTKPSQLGPMTVSVLAGADGRQRAEVERLMQFLEREARPDAISITNSMLSGVAPEIKRRLKLPVLCEVKGEDGFIDALPQPHRDQAIGLMRRNAQAVDAFIAPTEAYADLMAAYLAVPRHRISVVRSIVDAASFRRSGPRPREPFTVGYLSVITPRKGLHLLVEAFAKVVQAGRDVRLAVAGQVLDRRYWREVRRTLARKVPADRLGYLGEIGLAEKVALLHSLSVFCQPSIKPEALGTASLEAQAAGVPVIAPDDGVFPEMLGLTRGGRLFAAGNADALAAALTQMVDHPERADAMGVSAAEAVAREFSAAAAASTLEQLLTSVLGEAATGGAGSGESTL